jgi:predicted nucleic acid-binding protein
MIILDTNIISAFMQERPDEQVVRWLDRQPRSSVWTTSITVLETRLGLETMPSGRRQASLSRAFERLIDEVLERRIAAFDIAAAIETASLMSSRQRRGVPKEIRDSMIAGIARASRAALATRNVKDFDDLDIQIIDPWAS